MRNVTDDFRNELYRLTQKKVGGVIIDLRDKVDELENSNSDMTNLLASVDNATLFLGVDRTIQRFTPSATRLFNLIATGLGRPITLKQLAGKEPPAGPVARAFHFPGW
mgnify:CR=1 FL=1